MCQALQGYKFNVFYPDLLDKQEAPTYSCEPDPSGDGTTCLLRFHAGPPYEDIAFRCVRMLNLSLGGNLNPNFDVNLNLNLNLVDNDQCLSINGWLLVLKYSLAPPRDTGLPTVLHSTVSDDHFDILIGAPRFQGPRVLPFTYKSTPFTTLSQCCKLCLHYRSVG